MGNLIAGASVRIRNASFAASDEESGQTLVEYALIIAFVSVGALAALAAVSGNLNGLYDTVTNAL